MPPAKAGGKWRFPSAHRFRSAPDRARHELLLDRAWLRRPGGDHRDQGAGTTLRPRHWRTIRHRLDGIVGLTKELEANFKPVSARHPYKGSEPRF
jgi:hypothetical protein